MKLALDARLLLPPCRGMGQFTANLISPLRQQVQALLPAGAELPNLTCSASGCSFYPLWEQFTLPRLTRDSGATHLLCPGNTAPIHLPRSTRLIQVVHDLIYLEPLSRLPLSVSPHQNLGRLYRRLVVPRALHRADRLVTVSLYTKRQICDRFGVPEARVVVIPNSLEDSWFWGQVLPDSQREPYLLTVAGEAPSKNLSGLIHAFATLHSQPRHAGLRLVIAGVKPAYHARFDHLGSDSASKGPSPSPASYHRRTSRSFSAGRRPSFSPPCTRASASPSRRPWPAARPSRAPTQRPCPRSQADMRRFSTRETFPT